MLDVGWKNEYEEETKRNKTRGGERKKEKGDKAEKAKECSAES